MTWACAIDSDISNNLNDCAVQWNGGSYQTPVTDTVLVTNGIGNEWIEFDVTSDVQAFLAGSASNKGWLLKKTSESLNGDIELASKESAGNRPVLQVTVLNGEAGSELSDEYLEIIVELDQVGSTVNQTVVTQELIDSIDANLTRLKEIVIELQNLGFDGEARAERVGGKMVGTVRFYDSANQVLSETAIPDGTLGIFAAMGIREGFIQDEFEFPFERVADVLRASSGLVEAITNFEDDEIALNFVLASIAIFHPSAGNTFEYVGMQSVRGEGIIKILRILFGYIVRCINNEVCGPSLQTLTRQEGIKALEWIFPPVDITGTKFNDIDGDGIQEDGELGLGGWTFVVGTFNSDETFEGVSQDGSGFFIIEANVVRSTETIVLIEKLQPGWEVASAKGEVRDIPFTPLDVNFTEDSPPHIFQPAPEIFGNFKLGEISGIKFLDDGDGIKEAGEQGLLNWTIVLKNATNGVTLETTKTDVNGFYKFGGLTASTYRVEEVQQEGYAQTAPADGFYEVTVQSGTNSAGNDFGNSIDAPVHDVIWYGASASGSVDTVTHLQNLGLDVERRNRPLNNLEEGRVVFIGPFGLSQFNATEKQTLQNYVNNGGRVILAVDTDYFHCDPDTLCAMEISKDYGFGFDGDIQGGELVPASGQSSHPIWTTPRSLSSFTSWCCDGYVNTITDSNVKVLARTSGTSFETGEPTIFVSNVAAIVVNENPSFDGGKVLGGGYNMIVGIGDLRMIENIMTYLLGETVGGAPGGPYHYVELNQTSANATRPDNVTIEVEVEWPSPYWPAQPLEITLGNMTGIEITYTIESISNTTEYQIFEITFSVTTDVQVGDYAIPIIVRDLEDGYIQQRVFVLRVE